MGRKVVVVVNGFVVGNCYLIAVVLAASLALILAVGMDKEHRPGVEVVHTLEGTCLDEEIAVDLVLEVDNAAGEDTVMEGDNFGL